MNHQRLKNIIESLLMVTDCPLSIERLQAIVSLNETDQPNRETLQEVLAALSEDYAERGIELKEVASGYRLQVREDMAEWVNRLWEQRPPRYSKAMLETLAIIAYKQPVTRGDVEAIRGVSVSSSLMKTLQDRQWIRATGHRDVPGKPAIYATTKQFLDYFNLKAITELPVPTELQDIESVAVELFQETMTSNDAAPEEPVAQAAEADIPSQQEPLPSHDVQP